MVNNTFFDALLRLKEGLDRFRYELGYLYDPDGYASSEVVNLETEALICLYLNHPSNVIERLECAYQKAIAHHLMNTSQIAAAYAQLLPTLKVPITNRIWAEDDCWYNLGLEAHLADSDYITMVSLLVQYQIEKLTAQIQDQRQQSNLP